VIIPINPPSTESPLDCSCTCRSRRRVWATSGEDFRVR
jgi:hypothetical protein